MCGCKYSTLSAVTAVIMVLCVSVYIYTAVYTGVTTELLLEGALAGWIHDDSTIHSQRVEAIVEGGELQGPWH